MGALNLPNKDLLPLANTYPIVTPAEFWSRHGGGSTRTGSLVEAAELLGTNRHALRRLIAKHGITWWPYAQQQNGWRRPQRASA